MKALVIGAGFTGLAAAWKLQQAGWQVEIAESSSVPGGLAAGFQEKNWQWSLEHHYHHLFASDKEVLNWLAQMDLKKEIKFYRPKTSSWLDGKIEQLDSPLSLLQLKSLSPIEKVRMASVLAGMKFIGDGIWLDRWSADTALSVLMGKKAYQKIWQPLLVGKFGREYQTVNLAWFWARVKARTTKLGYPDGGFLRLAEKISKRIETSGVLTRYNHLIKNTSQFNQFDKVLITGTHQTFEKIVGKQPLSFTKVLGAVTLVLELNQRFFDDETYWLNITDTSWPFLAVVEHTQFIDSNRYGKQHLLYVGNYLPSSHRYFEFSAEQLLQEYLPKLAELNPQIKKSIDRSWVFKEKAAQPVPGVNHRQKVPAYSTAIDNLYWAGMEHVYPWDRGVNFAVRSGLEVAEQMINEN